MTQGSFRVLRLLSCCSLTSLSLPTGKGEFTMEYLRHSPVLPNVQKEMMEAHRAFAAKK
jgi:hypothetical protein